MAFRKTICKMTNANNKMHISSRNNKQAKTNKKKTNEET